jgi:hypothetical protein
MTWCWNAWTALLKLWFSLCTSHVRYRVFMKLCLHRATPGCDSDRGARRSGMCCTPGSAENRCTSAFRTVDRRNSWSLHFLSYWQAFSIARRILRARIWDSCTFKELPVWLTDGWSNLFPVVDTSRKVIALMEVGLHLFLYRHFL